MNAQAEDLFKLAELTPAELAAASSAAAGHPVPQAQAQAHAAPIGYDWGSPVTAGLWRVDVTSAGEAACTFFVKLVHHTRLWPGLRRLPSDEDRADFISYYPWHYELDIHESGIESVLPTGMRMPVLYHVARPDADHMGLWWEFIDQRPQPWELADYRLAARLLGQLAARRRAGARVNEALPSIARTRSGSALRFYTGRRVLGGVLPVLQAGQIWQHPVLRAAAGRAEDPDLAADMLALGARLPRLLDLLDELPQTYAHGDASPQNLLLPAAEPATIAVIDWGFGTLLPVGFDLGQLLVGLAHTGATDPAELPAIDAAIFPAYLDGLADEDYEVDPALVRAGYIGSLAARSALCAVPAETLAPAENLASAETLGAAGPDEETVAMFTQRLRLTRVLVDMAAETEPG
jgi:Phosphotransferase enzyme family